MGVNVRKAEAKDAPFLAQMILQSSRAGKSDGIFDYIFNDLSDSEILSRIEALTKTDAKNHCHYTNFLIGESNGVDVGTLCSYEPRIATKKAFFDALKEVGCDEEIEERLEFMNECDFGLNNRTLMFDFMVELEGYIDVGALKALMQKSLLTARLKGYRIAQTIVETGSLETMMFYEKLGFKKVKEKSCETYKEIFGRHGLTLLSIEF
ncbi:MAG: acyl-CoA acyltransferase [Epsilonproteobacteria bacterium]|nr:acyl-CoA acyltransferase [Campylobacterota bacterium]